MIRRIAMIQHGGTNLRVRSDVNHPTQQGEHMRAIAVNGSPRKNWKTPTAHVVRPSSSAGTFSRWWKTVYGQGAARPAGCRFQAAGLPERQLELCGTDARH